MCGPIAMAVPISRKSTWSLIFGSIQYNFGRILTYSILGLIVGIIGVSFKLILTFQVISIVSGILMVLFALSKIVQKIALFQKINSRLFGFVSLLFGKLKNTNSNLKPFFFGIINGFLPCGMVYLALINSLPSLNLLIGILSMIAFGFGTFLTMFFVPILVNTNLLKNRFQKLAPILLCVVGLSLILRGMNLGIPYLSPKIIIVKENNHNKPKVLCCKTNINNKN
jgi:sulfite exporter TauE/SafE